MKIVHSIPCVVINKYIEQQNPILDCILNSIFDEALFVKLDIIYLESTLLELVLAFRANLDSPFNSSLDRIVSMS